MSGHDYPRATPENWDPSQLRGAEYDKPVHAGEEARES